MADYIYTMEIRLTPDQQKGANLVQEITRASGMNLYLTGGAIRDIISGFPIRDLDFTVQGNPLKLQKELERAGAVVAAADEDSKTLFLQLPGNVRAEISMARTERYDKIGKPPVVTPATIIEDLRRRDFTGRWKKKRRPASTPPARIITSSTSPTRRSGTRSSSWRTKTIRCILCG